MAHKVGGHKLMIFAIHGSERELRSDKLLFDKIATMCKGKVSFSHYGRPEKTILMFTSKVIEDEMTDSIAVGDTAFIAYTMKQANKAKKAIFG